MNKRLVGSQGENKACIKLTENGFEILCTNYKVKEGEIDIIAKKANTLTFFEVKLRNNLTFGHPITSFPKNRVNRMSNASLRFVSDNQHFSSFDMAFYLVTIMGDEIKFIPIDLS